jgi:hypothetical protein
VEACAPYLLAWHRRSLQLEVAPQRLVFLLARVENALGLSDCGQALASLLAAYHSLSFVVLLNADSVCLDPDRFGLDRGVYVQPSRFADFHLSSCSACLYSVRNWGLYRNLHGLAIPNDILMVWQDPA